MKSAFDVIDEATRIEVPYCWIQWKGTNVCMDVHCACGVHMHVDAEFAYYLRCPNCQRVYGVGCHVKLVELTDPAHIAEASGGCLIDMEPDPDIPVQSESATAPSPDSAPASPPDSR